MSPVRAAALVALLSAHASAFATEPAETTPRRAVLVGGGQVTAPQQVSGSVGTLIAVGVARFEPGHHGSAGDGLLLQVEPGLAGLKASIGYGFLGGMVTGSARLSVVRTWGNPWIADPAETYVGPEVTASYVVKVGLGALYRTTGSEGRDWILTASVGVGF